MSFTMLASKLVVGDVVVLVHGKTATIAEVRRAGGWVFVRMTVNDASNKLIEKRWYPHREVVLKRTARI